MSSEIETLDISVSSEIETLFLSSSRFVYMSAFVKKLVEKASLKKVSTHLFIQIFSCESYFKIEDLFINIINYFLSSINLFCG